MKIINNKHKIGFAEMQLNNKQTQIKKSFKK